MLTILMGKSASGKDAIAKKLVTEGEFLPLVSTTTRPMREGEINGVDYEFIDKDAFGKRIVADDFIEYRKYAVVKDGQKDLWFYGTPKTPLNPKQDYIKIADVEGAKSLIEHYGRENCFVACVFADDVVRQTRAMSRGSFEMDEWMRRLADDTVRFDSAKVGEVANYIALNNDNSKHSLDTLTYYLTTALSAYKEKNKEKGEQYICSLYENEEGRLHVQVLNEKDAQKELSRRLNRLNKVSIER